MRNQPVCDTAVWILSPCETPDVPLARAAAKAGAYPVLHLGRDREIAQRSVDDLASRLGDFGVCLADGVEWEISLPDAVSTIVLPWGTNTPQTSADIVWQVRTDEEAAQAMATHPTALIIKGCEAGGVTGDDSAFILFQKLMPTCEDAGVPVYIQGGVGVHTASAYLALGAAGVVLDSQLALFPECGLPQDTKTALKRLTGPEVRHCGPFGYYLPPGQGQEPATLDGLYADLATGKSPILPLGQDVVLSSDLVDEHKKLTTLVRTLTHGRSAHVNQARISDSLRANGPSAQRLGTTYPITQGPMARISDVPEFLDDVAEGGGLPFLAMGMEEGQTARDMLADTAKRLTDKPWGAGILGFAPPAILAEQTRFILDAKPTHVLIAGGRPGQDTVFEKAGIHVLMHAPTTNVLDLLIKSGASSFIFEGRESGGHVGALYSTVLWEKQITAILNTPDPSEFLVLFAGGIHDGFSAAFVRVMAAPLTARGVKVGFQCGTAYLYTAEAVDTGAITATYQNLLLTNDTTYLLKSAFGQETRCIHSPFTDRFEQEKVRMEHEGLKSAEIQNRLEMLNLGRLRVASKGIGHDQGSAAPLNTEQQCEQGLFMTGSVSELTHTTTTIVALHEQLFEDSWRIVSQIDLPDDKPTQTGQADIAIIGMAGIFPGAENVEEFWRNIVFGTDCITEVPPERWNTQTFFKQDSTDVEHTASKWGGFIGPSDFDALEFGMPPESVTHIEPQQLLALLVSKRALEDAGVSDPNDPDLEETSVFFGVEGAGELIKARSIRTVLREIMGELPKDLDALIPHLTEYEFPSFLTNVTAGRISNRLNTCGRNFAVDAACSASLAALDIAVTELRTGKAEMAIVGGADLHNRIDDYLGFNSIGALSPKGRCATFDADADGLVISEAVCAVVIKRLEDAERDGNTIYAVIKGIGGSSDGKSLGLTAPSKRGQLLALERAYDNAGIHPHDVGLIEAHGTGTALGDWTEVGALTQFFLEDGTPPGRTALGSLKSIIGHTKTSAGIAGLIKAALCVRYGVLPPTAHVRKLNKAFTPGTPFNLRADKAGYWHESRRIAGVSAFGFGGTNFHAIVQNYEVRTADQPLASWPSELFVFPGTTPGEAEILMDKVVEMLGINDKLRLVDIAYSLSLRSIAKTIQYAIVAGTRDELLDRMRRAQEGRVDEFIHRLTPVEGKIAFLFPGQGSQKVNMAADLFTVFPRMRALLNNYPELEDVLFPPSAFTDAGKKRQRRQITDTRNAQPIMGIVDLAMADLLTDFGITPDVVAGHSYGELPALSYAGVIDPKDLVDLSRTRADAILTSIRDDKGRMAAVLTDEGTLSDLLTGVDGVWPVNYNAPQQIVVAGTSSGMEAFLTKAQRAQVTCQELSTDCAFHSPLIEGADEKFAAALQPMTFHEPTVTVMSNTDAGIYPSDETGVKDRLAAHLVNPVRFGDEIRQMARDGVAVFIEAGPGGSLTSLVTQSLGTADSVCVRIEDGPSNGVTSFLQGLAKYISTGRTVKMSELFKGRGAHPVYIEDPQSNAKQGLVFNVNGQWAVPDGGEFPTFREQVSQWFDEALSGNRPGYAAGDPGVEKVMLSYMANMGDLISNMGGMIASMDGVIHDQRDAVLGYLGASEIPRRTEPVRPVVTPPDPDTTTDETEVHDEPLSVASMSTEQITQMIFDVVSEKTGYPMSMLNLDTDLEADLSIDSIKKMEIVSELGRRLNMPATGGMEASFDTIISIKTFRDLVTWIEDMIAEKSDGGKDEEAGSGSTNKPPTDITRIVWRDRPCPITQKTPDVVKGKSFAVTDDGGGLALKAAEKLTSMGADVTLIDANADLTSFDGVILINSSAGTPYSVLDLFTLVKSADMEKLQWILTLDDSFGACLDGTQSSVPGGFSGFLTTLLAEYPGKQVCSVQYETLFDPGTFADTVADELTTATHVTQAVYRNGDRLIRVPMKAELDKKGEPQTMLDANSVVLVLGGAQGIAPHVVHRLAQDAPCLYVLVGRSVQDPDSQAYADCETVDDVKRVLIEKEGMSNPREINATAQRMFKSNHISDALTLIERAGARAVYRSADVTDPEEFGALIDQVRTEYGRIDGVIHAAGIVEDKLFRDKKKDSFARVYSTKAVPMDVLDDKLKGNLTLLVLFSSVVADFGNAGQCDYAAGNAVLDSAARLYARLYPTMRVVGFNWGPWKGAGMVSPAIQRESEKRGMSFISLDSGAEFCAEEIAYGHDPVVTALSANESVLQSFAEM